MPWGRSKTADDVASAGPVGDVSVPAGATDAATADAADATEVSDATKTATDAAAGAAAGAGATGSQPRGKVKGFGSKFRVGRGRASSADDVIKSPASTSSTVDRGGARTPTSPDSPPANASTGAGAGAGAAPDDSSSGEEEDTMVEILTPEEQAEQAKLDRWVMRCTLDHHPNHHLHRHSDHHLTQTPHHDPHDHTALSWVVVVKFLSSGNGMGKKVTAMFRQMDTDGSGDVDIAEFVSGMQELGLELTEQQYKGAWFRGLLLLSTTFNDLQRLPSAPIPSALLLVFLYPGRISKTSPTTIPRATRRLRQGWGRVAHVERVHHERARGA